MLHRKEIEYTLFFTSIILMILFRWFSSEESFELFMTLIIAGYVLISIGAYVLNSLLAYWLELYFRVFDDLIEHFSKIEMTKEKSETKD